METESLFIESFMTKKMAVVCMCTIGNLQINLEGPVSLTRRVTGPQALVPNSLNMDYVGACCLFGMYLFCLLAQTVCLPALSPP